jgi:hypothetical protein
METMQCPKVQFSLQLQCTRNRNHSQAITSQKDETKQDCVAHVIATRCCFRLQAARPPEAALARTRSPQQACASATCNLSPLSHARRRRLGNQFLLVTILLPRLHTCVYSRQTQPNSHTLPSRALYFPANRHLVRGVGTA